MQNKRPYSLPKPLTAPSDSLINLEIAKKYIRYHQQRLPRYRYLEALYEGFHDIFHQPEKETWKPDWRLAVNFPRYIVETFLGYGYGVPIKKTHPDERVDKVLREFEKSNDIEDHEHELEKHCCVYGHGFEYLYQDEEANTKMTTCTPQEMFIVYDDRVTNRALFAVRYATRQVNSVPKQYGEILTPDEVIEFLGDEVIERRPNPFGKIPVVEWVLNAERIGLFESVTSLVEAYNHTIAEKANDVDAFADAYLAIIGAEVDEEGVRHIRDDRLINLFGTDNARDVLVNFLSKPVADGTQENLLDRLERLIYQTAMVANISDENFGSAASGVSMAYKLQATSNLALTFDRKIKKSLTKRYKLFCTITTNGLKEDDWQGIEITTSRNLPKNRLEEAQTAQALDGLVSHETQLSVLSIVKNPNDEIEKMNKEDKAKQDDIVSRMLFPNQSVHNHDHDEVEDGQEEDKRGLLA